MSLATNITIISFSIITMYIVTQIMSFYDVDVSSYATYLVFYAFLIFSLVILPSNVD